MARAKKGSISSKILSTHVVLSAILVVFIMGIVFYQFNSVIEKNVLETNVDFAMELINKEFKGDWKVEGEKLYKGDKLINDEFSIVDSVKNITKADVTIFLNDTRINTTVEENGVRKVGTKAAENVIDKVIKKGEKYSGKADVVGVKYSTIYKPITDAQGKVIGMFFLGYPQSYILGIVNGALIYIIIASIILLALGIIGFNLLIKNNIIKPIDELNENLVLVSKFNFKNTNINEKLKNRKDEIGEMFNCLDNMINTLKDEVVKLSNSSISLFEESNSLSAVSEEMAASSEQVSASIQEVSNGAQNQANSIEDIQEAVDNLSSSIDNVYNKLNEVKEEVYNAENKAVYGKKEMDNLIASISEIKTAFNLVAEKLNLLNESVGNISSIADTIKGISEQTNLLALNAAIEASRAGEAGRGFAVVADEVRKLAEESKKSTDEIVNIINVIQNETNEVIVTSNNVEEFIDKQTTAVENTVKSFGDILSSVENITPLIDSTYETVNGMVEYKDETSAKVDMVNQVATENLAVVQEVSSSSEELTASSEEVAQAAQKLTQLAEELKGIVDKFEI